MCVDVKAQVFLLRNPTTLRREDMSPEDGGQSQDSFMSPAENEESFIAEVQDLEDQLMEDPVADGSTYERQESPSTQEIANLALFPKRDKKSAMVLHRERVVQRVQVLIKQHMLSGMNGRNTLQLLNKTERFVRPLLPDTSARKQLVSLLLLRVKLMRWNRDSLILEITLLLLATDDVHQLQDFLGEIQEHEFLCLLEKLEDDAVKTLRAQMKRTSHSNLGHREAIDLEFARRLVRRLGHSDDSIVQMFDLTDLWSLLIAHHEDFWVRPSAMFLASSIRQLHVDLQTLGDQLLYHAYRCLDEKEAAMAIASDFFQHDLGMSTADWPPKECASIIMELAMRTHDNQERAHLLVRAYNMDPGNEVLRALAKQLAPVVLVNFVNPAQLMTLAQQVGAKRRRLDGSQLAVKAAPEQHFAAMAEEKSQDAFLEAFSDRSNADGLIQALRAKERRKFFEKSCQDRAVMSFVWNLSVYDFTRFRKGGQTSVKLPLTCWGINAWMSLYPMGEDGSLPGKASLRLHFENAFYVRGKVRGGSQADTNLSLDRPGTWLRRNFMDTSEILLQKDAWITLQIVSVQLPALQLGVSGASTLRRSLGCDEDAVQGKKANY
eukprot:s2183_g13.t1